MAKFYTGLYQELELYVRYAAWLHAVPKAEDTGPLSKKIEAVSRLETIQLNRDDLTMPPIQFGGYYLLEYFWDCGAITTGGMGATVITYIEIQAWQQLMGLDLKAWELSFLRRLSAAYVNELNRAEAADAVPPYGWVPHDRGKVESKIVSILKGRIKPNG